VSAGIDSTTHRAAQGKRIVICLLAAIAVGGGVRIYLAWTASVIARDGVLYVSMARRMVTDWRGEIPRDYPLGYPFLVRCVHGGVGRLLSDEPIIAWQRSGQLVSLAFGIACIPLVFWLGRRMLGTRCGLIGAWIWALLPQAASLSADALTDMPHLALVLSALALAMIGLQSPGLSLRALFGAGLLSGAAYTLRTEGAEVALVTCVFAILRPRLAFSRRAAAVIAIVAGFTVLGGSYVAVEGGRFVNKQNWTQETALAPTDRVVQYADAGIATFAKAAGVLVTKLSQSLNGFWLMLGLAFPFLPGHRRLRRGARVPIALLVLHTAVLIWLYCRAGYISSRHLLLLNVGFVILSAGTLAWAARRLARRSTPALRNADAIAVILICLALTPWLLRDINFARWYVRDAGHWIAERFGGSVPTSIVAVDGWAPYYGGAADWKNCRTAAELSATHEILGANLLVLGLDQVVPPRVRVDTIGREVELAEQVRFVDPSGKRGLVIYAVRPIEPDR
jgi:hypothetical protein